jgi:hypothetical protein
VASNLTTAFGQRAWFVVHPREKRGSRLIGVNAAGLPGVDPEADKVLGELPEAAPGVVGFVGLCMAACKEGPEQGRGAPARSC